MSHPPQRFIFAHDDIGIVAMPTEWREPKHWGGPGFGEHMSVPAAKKPAALFLDIGSARETLSCIESLFVAVNQIYTLVDEGDLDSRFATLCFKERE